MGLCKENPMYNSISTRVDIIGKLRRKLEAAENAVTQCLSDIESYKLRIDNLMENFNSDQETIHYFMQEMAAQKAKYNIYNCMDRKDLKLRIEQLEIILAAERKNVTYAQNKWSKHAAALESIRDYGKDSAIITTWPDAFSRLVQIASEALAE